MNVALLCFLSRATANMIMKEDANFVDSIFLDKIKVGWWSISFKLHDVIEPSINSKVFLSSKSYSKTQSLFDRRSHRQSVSRFRSSLDVQHRIRKTVFLLPWSDITRSNEVYHFLDNQNDDIVSWSSGNFLWIGINNNKKQSKAIIKWIM